MHVALYVTCIADLIRPSVAFSSLRLLEDAGCTVSVPSQSCCGQPAYNNGNRQLSKKLAIQVFDSFKEFEFVVIPSGSCASYMKLEYSKLFPEDDEIKKFSNKIYELSTFLVEVLDYQPTKQLNCNVTYHDSCSGLRKIGVKSQPRILLEKIKGLSLIENQHCEECCGFGGVFSLKNPELSESIAMKKLKEIQECGTNTVIGGDLGCLLHLEKHAKQKKINIKFYHFSDILLKK